MGKRYGGGMMRAIISIYDRKRPMALRPLFVLCMYVIMKPFQRIVIMYTRNNQFHSCVAKQPFSAI